MAEGGRTIDEIEEEMKGKKSKKKTKVQPLEQEEGAQEKLEFKNVPEMLIQLISNAPTLP